jgi:hypothetical protein
MFQLDFAGQAKLFHRKTPALALVSILQRPAAAEVANALHLRDFRSPRFSSFSTQSTRSSHLIGSETLPAGPSGVRADGFGFLS